MNGHSRREFLVRAGAASVVASLVSPAQRAAAAEKESSTMNLNAMIQPVPRSARFIDDDWYIWGGSMTRTDDGVCHLLYARWPRKLGFSSWLSHSEIAHATATDPLGPYTFDSVALPGKGGHWPCSSQKTATTGSSPPTRSCRPAPSRGTTARHRSSTSSNARNSGAKTANPPSSSVPQVRTASIRSIFTFR
jgi:hypothetical protein